MTDIKRINQLFDQSYNCAQIVFSELGPALGLDRDECLRIASGFGAGMAYMQEVCGAVSGSFMVLGTGYGNYKEKDKVGKQATYELVREFAKRFKAKHGSINCRALLGYDISTPEGQKAARDLKVFETKCPHFVYDAIEILHDLMAERKNQTSL